MLDLAGNFQVPLHGDAVSEFQHQQKKQSRNGKQDVQEIIGGARLEAMFGIRGVGRWSKARIAKNKAMSRKTRRAGESFISIAQKSALVVFLNRRPRVSLRSASQSISRV